MCTADTNFLLIERLRKENLEQFLTLVRMHLSFVVDINTEDVDSPTDKPKQFRWNFHKKTKSVCINSSHNNASGTKSCAETNSITEDGLMRLYELIDFLSSSENVTQEGIFRRTGSLSRQQELKQLLLTGSNLGLDNSKFSVHDCASVLKGFIAELPQPLLMDQYYQIYCTLAAQYPPNEESSEAKLLPALQLLLLLLTPSHRSFLQRLLTLLRLVADNEASNRMSPDTLATMFTPHLLCPRKLSPETFHADAVAISPVISFMIRHSARLFAAPPQLATDAAAYFTARERKHVQSPHQDLDESITDRTAANTVYTFVDRHRTRVENETNPTDTALAQLYAHIQSLPDSHNKRRLIKHFNRQNGHGTPIRIQSTGKVAGSRSFGDSIKKHIFNKGLLNKTPKEGSSSRIDVVEEKSSAKGNLQVSHKNINPKNFANKTASTESLDVNDDYESDTSHESTLSEGVISKPTKSIPTFGSQPNLSVLDDEKTPKVAKKRLFLSKLAKHVNKKYHKRETVVKGTPKIRISCYDDQDTGSANDISVPEKDGKQRYLCDTPTNEIEDLHYLTSTPGMSHVGFGEDCSTPYSMNFRRPSMSPITKSTQKLSKAMQESIMTPRSRKPLIIITSEQRDSLPEAAAEPDKSTKCDVYQSMSLKNDSDFVSSDDDMARSRSAYSSDSSHHSTNTSIPKSKMPQGARSISYTDVSVRSQYTHFVLNRERPTVSFDDLYATLSEEKFVPKFEISEEESKSLTEPFREYLISRSVLTATPIDLSILNQSTDTDEIMSESLKYCLDGNVPSDLTSSIDKLAVANDASLKRSPLQSISINSDNSPNRKRCVSAASSKATEIKKALFDKKNCTERTRETEL